MIKTIPNYLEYGANDIGEIFKYTNTGIKKLKIGQFAGEQIVRLTKKRTMINVKRLVAEAFIPNPMNLEYIKHINGDKSDNRIGNLAWCDKTGNANPTTMHIEVDRNGAKWLVPKDDFMHNVKLVSKNSDETIEEAELVMFNKPKGMSRFIGLTSNRKLLATLEDKEDAYMDAVLAQYEKENRKAIKRSQTESRALTILTRSKPREFSGLNAEAVIDGTHLLHDGNDDDDGYVIDEEGYERF